ncbi:MAG: hypothetical protein JSS04_19790 [Proteobacteria bacterium]|nr:hypothetical protein [Pseudomonadota bacterium]
MPLFATAGAALQQVERVANRGGNGDDGVFAHVWVETHTVSLGAAYKF